MVCSPDIGFDSAVIIVSAASVSSDFEMDANSDPKPANGIQDEGKRQSSIRKKQGSEGWIAASRVGIVTGQDLSSFFLPSACLSHLARLPSQIPYRADEFLVADKRIGQVCNPIRSESN